MHGVLWLNLAKLEKKEKKFVGAKSIFKKLRGNEPLNEAERQVVCNMVDEFTTVSLCSAEVGQHIVKKVKELNNHRHTKKACKKENRPGCRQFSFYALPKCNIMFQVQDASISIRSYTVSMSAFARRGAEGS